MHKREEMFSPFCLNTAQLSLLLGELVTKLRTQTTALMSIKITAGSTASRSRAPAHAEIIKVGRCTLPTLRASIAQAATLLIVRSFPDFTHELRFELEELTSDSIDQETEPREAALELVDAILDRVQHLTAQHEESAEIHFWNLNGLLAQHALITDRQWTKIANARQEMLTRSMSTRKKAAAS